MAVMARETWTDERLDDLAKRIDKGFDATKVEIRDLRADMKEEIHDLRADMKEEVGDLRGHTDKGLAEVKKEVRDLRIEMNTRFAAVEARFDAMQRTMIIGFASIVASIVATQL